MKLVDSHCHIDGDQFDEDRQVVIQRAREEGVVAMLNVGTGDPFSNDFRRAVSVAEQYEGVYASVGVHPHDAKLYNDTAESHLVELIKASRKVIAWGEIGLDFYYEHSPRDIQIEVFRRQIRKAIELDLPIIIHSREADNETVAILREECSAANFRGGIMHCFAGSPAMAETLMNIGFLISFAGNITFKKADNLRLAASAVPLDKLLVETDCPFLTPVPLRGKRNEPSYVVHTARFMAEHYNVELETLAAQTTQNFEEFFGVRIPEFNVGNNMPISESLN